MFFNSYTFPHVQNITINTQNPDEMAYVCKVFKDETDLSRGLATAVFRRLLNSRICFRMSSSAWNESWWNFCIILWQIKFYCRLWLKLSLFGNRSCNFWGRSILYSNESHEQTGTMVRMTPRRQYKMQEAWTAQLVNWDLLLFEGADRL